MNLDGRPKLLPGEQRSLNVFAVLVGPGGFHRLELPDATRIQVDNRHAAFASKTRFAMFVFARLRRVREGVPGFCFGPALGLTGAAGASKQGQNKEVTFHDDGQARGASRK